MVSTAVSDITAPSAFNRGNACDCPPSPNTAENCNNLACKKAIAQIAILRKWKNAEEIPRGALLLAIFHTSSHDTDHKMTITTLKEFVKLEDTNDVQGAGLFWWTRRAKLRHLLVKWRHTPMPKAAVTIICPLNCCFQWRLHKQIGCSGLP